MPPRSRQLVMWNSKMTFGSSSRSRSHQPFYISDLTQISTCTWGIVRLVLWDSGTSGSWKWEIRWHHDNRRDNLHSSCVPTVSRHLHTWAVFVGEVFFFGGHAQVDVTLEWNWAVRRTPLNIRIGTWSLPVKQYMHGLRQSVRYKEQGIVEQEFDKSSTFLEIEHSVMTHGTVEWYSNVTCYKPVY